MLTTLQDNLSIVHDMTHREEKNTMMQNPHWSFCSDVSSIIISVLSLNERLLKHSYKISKWIVWSLYFIQSMLMVDDVKPIGVASAHLSKIGVTVAAPVTSSSCFVIVSLLTYIFCRLSVGFVTLTILVVSWQ